MGNVIAIGLTPSRTGIDIGPLLNAQLRHMSVRVRGGINDFYFAKPKISSWDAPLKKSFHVITLFRP